MELYDLYRYIFIGGAIACGVCLAIAVVLFFLLRIPKVISDLSGRTARKAIESIRLQNEQSGDKTYQSSAVNLERGKLTDKISPSGRLVPRDATPFGTGVITEKISTQQLDETDVLSESENTTLLTSELGEAENTTVLTSDLGETAVLTHDQAVNVQTEQEFVVEFEITFIHTDEVIA